jgi:esterase/lipase superfamily enzyme
MLAPSGRDARPVACWAPAGEAPRAKGVQAVDLFASVPDWLEWAGAGLLVAGLLALILRLGADDDLDSPDERRDPEDYRLREQRRTVQLELDAGPGAEMASLKAELQRRIDAIVAHEGEPDAPAPPGADEYRVWYGTNRKPVDPADPSLGYAASRDRIVRYGYCDVFVPESHKIGSVGSSALRRLLTWTDDRLRLRAVAALDSDSYWDAVASQIGELPAGEKHAVVFIHGFNVSFEEAAIRAAQIGFDLGIGAMAFFSWPSKGRVTRRAYQSDGQSIGASETAIADFLADFARRSGAEAVHVIVHSMGNQGVLRAMNRILAGAGRRGGCRFGQLILAAADVDSDTFETLAGAYRELAARTTLYVSERDLALSVSAWFADYPRVGLYPPVSVFDGIDTVSVSSIDLTLLGHGYVGGARDVLQDMHRLIFTGEAPPRFGLRPRRNAEGKAYWEVGA